MTGEFYSLLFRAIVVSSIFFTKSYIFLNSTRRTDEERELDTIKLTQIFFSMKIKS